MTAALLIAANDLRRRLRDRSAIIVAFVAPLALALIIGIAFGTDTGSNHAKVGLVVQDHTTPAAQAVASTLAALQLGPGVSLEREASAAQARADLASSRVEAYVVVLDGYGAGAPYAHLPVRAITKRGSEFSGAVANAIADSLLGHQTDALLAARTAAPGGGAAVTALVPAAAAMASPLHLRDVSTGGKQGFLGYFAPSMAIVFLFISVGAGARSLLGERDTGTLARLRAAPVRIESVVGGKVAAIFGLSLLSLLTVWGVIVLGFGVTWGPPADVAALCVASALAFSAIGLFLTVLARSPDAADAATAIVGVVLALLGGNFFPPGSLPPLFQRLALITPNGWALQGFGSLALDHRGFGAIVLPLVVLLVIGAVLTTASVRRLRALVATP